MELTFHCHTDNDLFQVLAGMDRHFPRYDTFAAALKAAPENSAVLTLADAYPRPDLQVDAEHLRLAVDKGLRLYLEYPAAVPGIDLGDPRPTQWERAVVASDFFGPDLEKGVSTRRRRAIRSRPSPPVEACRKGHGRPPPGPRKPGSEPG